MERWFTPQERGVVLFLIFALVLGGIIYIYKLKNPYFAPELKITREEKRDAEIQELIQKTKTNLESLDSLTTQVNINKASKKELMKLSGIGEVYAQRIIDYRERNNGFKNIEEIKRIRGIGKKKFDKLKEKITI
ncbi:helix-hairpin-helix domain-containing protein [candidate division WOR-3 bacterium]|nr:helix-hairpin-helix domain-containing protein [candidate division WOR-3 bacterium]